MPVSVLSAGAAKGLIAGLESRFAEHTGHSIVGSFGAIGAMRDSFIAQAPCDVIVLSAAMIEQLMADGQLVPGSARDLGRVRTGVAVCGGASQPDVGSPAALAQALESASGLWFPDPQKATAGIHFMKVLTELGLAERLAPRLHPYPNGATAMAAMATQGDPKSLGVTQVTEILYTAGVDLVAPLPREFELATVYTIAVTARATDPALAARLVALASGPELAEQRREGGFE